MTDQNIKLLPVNVSSESIGVLSVNPGTTRVSWDYSKIPHGTHNLFLSAQPVASVAPVNGEVAAMESVMRSVDPATWPGLTLAQRCALGRFAKPQPAQPAEPLCEDEGCSHHGTPHICVSSAQPVPHDWDEHVRRAWQVLRKHDHTIPDEVIDLMRDLLLGARQDDKSDWCRIKGCSHKNAGSPVWETQPTVASRVDANLIAQFFAAEDRAHALDKPLSSWVTTPRGTPAERREAWKEVHRLRALLTAQEGK